MIFFFFSNFGLISIVICPIMLWHINQHWPRGEGEVAILTAESIILAKIVWAEVIFFLILIFFFCYFATDLIIVSQDNGFSSIPVSVSLSVRPIFKNFNANVSYYWDFCFPILLIFISNIIAQACFVGGLPSKSVQGTQGACGGD